MTFPSIEEGILSATKRTAGATKGSIRVNGESRPLGDGGLAGLLAHLGYAEDQQGVAVALNGCVVPRSQWKDRALAEGDVIEIVGAVQGG